MEIKFIPPFAEVWPFRAQDFQLHRNTILMIQSLLYSLQPSCAKTLQVHPFCEAFLRCFHENAKEGCGRACLLYLDFAACKKKNHISSWSWHVQAFLSFWVIPAPLEEEEIRAYNMPWFQTSHRMNWHDLKAVFEGQDLGSVQRWMSKVRKRIPVLEMINSTYSWFTLRRIKATSFLIPAALKNLSDEHTSSDFKMIIFHKDITRSETCLNGGILTASKPCFCLCSTGAKMSFKSNPTVLC